MFRQLFYFLKCAFGELLQLGGMEPNCREHTGVVLCQAQRLLAGPVVEVPHESESPLNHVALEFTCTVRVDLL